MTTVRSVVLVAGVPQSSFGELAPVLDRQKLTVIQVPSIEEAVMYARSARVELIILGTDPTSMSLEEVIQTIRSQSSASRNASLLVMAEPNSEDNVRQLIGHGVNRVMLTVDPPKLVSLQVAELLKIAPRASLRLSTRMLVEVEDGFAEALGAVVNISAAGLLLETDADLKPGQHVIISIDVGRQLEPVAAKAEIVRQADPKREGIEGIGAQFLAFAGDSQNRLETILSDAFRIPIDEVRTAS
jgi:DNA-binding NarL/FixJ family response regulator